MGHLSNISVLPQCYTMLPQHEVHAKIEILEKEYGFIHAIINFKDIQSTLLCDEFAIFQKQKEMFSFYKSMLSIRSILQSKSNKEVYIHINYSTKPMSSLKCHIYTCIYFICTRRGNKADRKKTMTWTNSFTTLGFQDKTLSNKSKFTENTTKHVSHKAPNHPKAN